MENILWNLFMNTGNIHFYLQYKRIQRNRGDQKCTQEEYERKEAILR
ncbi:YqzL family protein [Thermotalea metallivorans]